MIKKRIIMSNLFNEPRPHFPRAFLAATLGILVAVCLAGTTQAQVTEVWPTGDRVLDQFNVENAVHQGGTVILHAKNIKKEPTAFNFSYVYIPEDVTIEGEKLPSHKYFHTSHGDILSDRTVVYCTDKYGGKMAFRLTEERKLVIEGLRFDGFIGWAVYINACSSDGVQIRDNVITHVLRGKGRMGIEIWDIPSWPEEVRGSIVIEDNTIEAAEMVGIRVRRAPELHILNNTITDPMSGRGMWLTNVAKAAITNNTITGEMLRGIQFSRTSNSVISNNMIDRVISPPWHKWWNGAIALDDCTGCTVQGNTIRGEGRSAIHLHNTDDSYILDNDCSDYTANSPQLQGHEERGLCQLWFGKHSDGNTVSGNIWGPVPSDGVAVVLVSARGVASNNLNILDNDYGQSGVPGWNNATPVGPGCVLLANGTQNTFVFESGNFPKGTGGAKKQVVDLTRELTGSTTNRVIGHPANFLAEDECPGIGQRLQDIMDQLDALPIEEEEEEALLDE